MTLIFPSRHCSGNLLYEGERATQTQINALRLKGYTIGLFPEGDGLWFDHQNLPKCHNVSVGEALSIMVDFDEIFPGLMPKQQHYHYEEVSQLN